MPLRQLLTDEQCLELLNVLWRDSITGLVLVNKDGYFISANPTFCKLTEYTEAELQTKRFHDITDPRDVDADSKEAQLVYQGDSDGYDMTKRYIVKTQRFLLILLRVSALRTNDQFIYFVSQIYPLDVCEISPEDVKKADNFKNTREFFNLIRTNWLQITAGLAAISYVIRKAIE